MTLPLPPARADFAGRLVWIVGAAGALGSAIAATLAAAGARLVLGGRQAAPLDALAARLPAPAPHLALTVDVRSTASVQAAADTIAREAGPLDGLVNATTLPLFGDPLELDDTVWQAVFETKQLGYLRTMRAVLPGMVARGRGAIVNLSGRGGRQPNPVHLPGGSANAAVNHLTKGLADRFGPAGIRINAVAPGPVASQRLAALQAAGAGKAPGWSAPAGQPGDVAEAVAFLLSDRARHINGTVLAVDGGSLACV